MAGEPQRHFKFDDFWLPPSFTPSRYAALTRIEEASASETGQVYVEHGFGRFNDYLPIDSLVDHPQITSIVSDGPVMANVRLPQIRELLLDAYGHEIRLPTARNLPNLQRLVVSHLDLGMVADLPELVDLGFDRFEHPEQLSSMTGLERLAIRGEVFGESAVLFEPLQNLRWLRIDSWKGLRSLNALTRLERLVVSDASVTNLRSWRSLTGLTHLLFGGSPKSLDGIEMLKDLRVLSLGIGERVDLAPITACPLEELELYYANAPPSLSVVAGLHRLRRFKIELGNINRNGVLQTVSFLEGLRDLEEVEFRVVDLQDRRLDPLFDLPLLRRVTITGAEGPNVDELRRRRPEVDVVARLQGEPEGRTRVGTVAIDHPPGSDRWSIRHDLAQDLGFDSQDDAEDLLRTTLRRRDPALFRRLSWDSESGGIGAHARSEADIRALAEVVNDLATRRPRSG